jgi:hypothetical protein
MSPGVDCELAGIGPPPCSAHALAAPPMLRAPQPRPPLPDPNPFFKALLGKPYRGAVVLSPAVYNSAAPAPPAASYQLPSWPVGPSPVKVMDTTFSYLAKEGYCQGDDCQVFPVAVGEFASKLAALTELSVLNEFAAHLAAAAVDYGGVGTWRFWGFDRQA